MNLAEVLADQGWAVEKESASASLYNHTPWVAPEAYLHWLFKPATPRALEETRTLPAIREEWLDFLSIQNGAMLYSDSLSIFGAVESGTLLNRNSPHDLGPYSLLDQKRKSAAHTHMTARKLCCAITMAQSSYSVKLDLLTKQGELGTAQLAG